MCFIYKDCDSFVVQLDQPGFQAADGIKETLDSPQPPPNVVMPEPAPPGRGKAAVSAAVAMNRQNTFDMED